jgi:hypothetical protein
MSLSHFIWSNGQTYWFNGKNKIAHGEKLVSLVHHRFNPEMVLLGHWKIIRELMAQERGSNYVLFLKIQFYFDVTLQTSNKILYRKFIYEEE